MGEIIMGRTGFCLQHSLWGPWHSPCSSLNASTRHRHSSWIRSSRGLFPKPKFRRVVKVNLLCCFHKCPLEETSPGRNTPPWAMADPSTEEKKLQSSALSPAVSDICRVNALTLQLRYVSWQITHPVCWRSPCQWVFQGAPWSFLLGLQELP